MIASPNLPTALGRFPELIPQSYLASSLTRLPYTSALRHPAWSASDIKDGAHELRQAVRGAGVNLSHGLALKIASSAYGFPNWNAALALLGPREGIAVPETVSAFTSRFERLSHCSPLCMHGNFPGLVDRLMGQGAAKQIRAAPATSLIGALSSDGPMFSMLVLSKHQKDFERLKARYPIKNVVFMDMPFEDAIWQALRLDFDHILIDRPNAVTPVSFETFCAMTEGVFSGHNVIISTENPTALWDDSSYLRDKEGAYEAFLSV